MSRGALFAPPGLPPRPCGNVSPLAAALAIAAAAAGCSRRDAPVPAAAASALAKEAEPCETLASRLCGHFGRPSSVCEIVERQARRFTNERCAQMLGSFRKTVSDLEETRTALQTLATPDQSTGRRPTPAIGPVDAEITIVKFCDFESSNCGRVSPMARAIESFGHGRVRFIFRQFPMSSHPHAYLAAEASLAANAQGKFWEYYEILFANPHDKSRAALDRYAKEAGLDLEHFRMALDEHRFAADVDADCELGRRALVESVPAVFVNGKRANVPYGVSELASLVDGATARR